jgi:hypothetical protein
LSKKELSGNAASARITKGETTFVPGTADGVGMFNWPNYIKIVLINIGQQNDRGRERPLVIKIYILNLGTP